MLITLKYGMAVAFEQGDQFGGGPAVVFFYQSVWHLVVAQGYKRLDTVFSAFLKYMFVKDKSCFIWAFFHACGENPRPVNGGAEYLKPHLGKQGDIFPDWS